MTWGLENTNAVRRIQFQKIDGQAGDGYLHANQQPKTRRTHGQITGAAQTEVHNLGTVCYGYRVSCSEGVGRFIRPPLTICDPKDEGEKRKRARLVLKKHRPIIATGIESSPTR
jgi:hypothetical protein